MRKLSIIMLLGALLTLSLVSGAASSGASLNTYLSQYISNSSLNTYSFSNVTVNGSSYVVLQSIVNQSSYLVVNSTNGRYALITNNNTIYSVLSTVASSKFTNNSQLSLLQSDMAQYEHDIEGNLTNCSLAVGAGPNVTNINATLNACYLDLECRTIVYGGKFGGVTYEGQGPDSPFAYGLLNFSINQNQLNRNITTYVRLLNQINSTNVGQNIAALGSHITNISSISQNFNQNPIFPPPQSANFGECGPSLTPAQNPWFCSSIPYCQVIPFNNTVLGSISSIQSSLASSIPTSSELKVYSQGSATLASGYILAGVAKKNQTAYNAFLNYSYPLYNTTVAEVSGYLSKVPNANLSASLSTFESNFASLKANALYHNITVVNQSFHALLSNTLIVYNQANQSYSAAYSLARNTTIDAVAAQLNYKEVPVRLALIISQIQSLDSTVASTTNTTKLQAAAPQLKTLDLELGIYVAPFTMGHAVKVLDGWFIHIFISGSSASLSSKEASAPLYAAIESIIIGIIILAIIYLMTYHNLQHRHKLRRNKRSGMAWKVLFIVLFVLVLVYAYVTYTFAVSANNFLPLSYFTSYLKGAKSAYIVLNGSSSYSSQSVTNCAQSIAAVLKSQGKNVSTIDATNGTCVANGDISPLGVNCYDHALAIGTPVITLSATGSGISYKGLYGYQMFASGSSASGSSCIVSSIISRKG